MPLTDEYMSEYVGDYAQRLGWLTGFGGSAGTAAVLPDKAAIFTDGRYTIQVREQVSADEWDYVAVPETSVADWLAANVVGRVRIGYDPWLHTRACPEQVRAALSATGADANVSRRTRSTRYGTTARRLWPRRSASTPTRTPARVRPRSARALPTGWAKWAPTRW